MSCTAKKNCKPGLKRTMTVQGLTLGLAKFTGKKQVEKTSHPPRKAYSLVFTVDVTKEDNGGEWGKRIHFPEHQILLFQTSCFFT